MASSTNGRNRFPTLDPEEQAGVATQRVLRALLVDLEFNQAEFLRDAAGDYLHDFRVALRRTRCVLGQSKGVFPAGLSRRFRADFAALGQLSSATRDWEVGLQWLAAQADDQRTTLRQPLRLALAALQTLFTQRYTEARETLKTHLRSEDHQRLLQDWRAFLNDHGARAVPDRVRHARHDRFPHPKPLTAGYPARCPPGKSKSAPGGFVPEGEGEQGCCDFHDSALPEPHAALPRAAQPIQKRIDRRIARLHQRILAEGSSINRESPPEAWHALRKTCKKLRYLLELFHSLYPARRYRRLVGLLKQVQEQLGIYQDCQVQAATLLRLADESGTVGLSVAPGGTTQAAASIPPLTLMTMGAVLQLLDQQADAARAGFERCYVRLMAG